MSNKKFTETFKLQCESIKYEVNESRGTVVAIAHFHIPTYVLDEDDIDTIGVARLDPKDTFKENIGKKVARAKAEQEAYIQFKMLVMKYRKRIALEVEKAQNTINKLNSCIRHQKEYIKSF